MRRIAGRGIGGRRVSGGGPITAPFDPLADPDLIGLWTAQDGTDDGSALTIPNRSGGAAFTATGGGRPTLDATGLEGGAAILCNGATVSLQAAIGAALSTYNQLTVYCSAMADATTPANQFLWGIGGAQTASTVVQVSLADSDRADARRTSRTHRTNATRWVPLNYPRVFAYRAGSTVVQTLWTDNTRIPGAAPTAYGAANFANVPIFLASDPSSASRFTGRIGTIAVIGREHTDAEVAQWTTYIRALDSQTQTVDFMWCGDSITACSAVGGAQWRSAVEALYQAAGGSRFYRTVGTQAKTSQAPFARDRMLGQGGDYVQRIRDYLTLPAFYDLPNGFAPRVIPIMIGTNDLGPPVSGTTATLATQYAAMLDEFAAAWPSALLVAQKLTPRTDAPDREAKVIDWNDNYHAGVVSAAQGRGVNVISDDTFANLSLSYTDGLHPAAASEATIAAAMWARAQAWAAMV